SASAVDRANEALLASIAARGDLVVTGTRLRGRYAIRLCILNHTSAEDDVRYAIERVAAEPWPGSVDGSDGSGRRPRPRDGRDAGVDVAWLAVPAIDPDRLRRVTPFRGTTDEQARRFLAAGRER